MHLSSVKGDSEQLYWQIVAGWCEADPEQRQLNSSSSMHGNLLLVYVTTDHDSVGCSQIAEIMHSV